MFLYYRVDCSQRLGRSDEFRLTDHAIHDAILKKVLTVVFGGFYCHGQGKSYFDKHKTVDYEILKFIGGKAGFLHLFRIQQRRSTESSWSLSKLISTAQGKQFHKLKINFIKSHHYKYN